MARPEPGEQEKSVGIVIEIGGREAPALAKGATSVINDDLIGL